MKNFIILLLGGLFLLLGACKKDSKQDVGPCFPTSEITGKYQHSTKSTEQIQLNLQTACLGSTPQHLPGFQLAPVEIGEISRWYEVNIPVLPDEKRKDVGTIYIESAQVTKVKGELQIDMSGHINWTDKFTYILGNLTPVGSGEGKKPFTLSKTISPDGGLSFNGATYTFL